MPQRRSPLDQYEVNQIEESKRNGREYNGNYTAGDVEVVKTPIAKSKASSSPAYEKARLAKLKKAAAQAAEMIMGTKPGDTINSKARVLRGR